jgi:hypothetical protein
VPGFRVTRFDPDEDETMTRTKLSFLLAALLPLAAGAEPLRYAGSLTDAGQPAEGRYLLRVSVHDAPSEGRRVGPEITLPDVEVHDGRFETEFELGVPLSKLSAHWLQLEVAAADGRFEPLAQREPLDPKALAAVACWNTAGNAGTDPLTDFLGTTDARMLTLRAGNRVALRLTPDFNGPSVIGGHPTNAVSGGGIAQTIAGGFDNAIASTAGQSSIGGGAGNRVNDGAATISGGTGNTVLATWGVVAGGNNNIAGFSAVVPGGQGNVAGGSFSFAAGTLAKVRGETQIGTVAGTGTPDGDTGTFAWGDQSTNTPWVSTGSNQFLVRAAGGVGVNTNAPKAALHVRSGAAALAAYTPDPGSVLVTEKASGNSFVTIMGSAQRGLMFGEPAAIADGGIYYDSAASNAMELRTNGNVTRLTIAANGDLTATAQAFKPGGGSWAVSSDARLKRDVAPLDGALGRLLALRGVRYTYRDPDPARRPAGEHAGFIAQEVQRVFPRWVSTDADGYMAVAPQGFEALTVEALRELAEENAVIAAENAQLRAAHASLARRLERIEAALAAER